MSERALAHIEKIEWVKPIEGADNIELIGVLGWVCIAKKEEFKEGDLAVYIEIDSRVPKEDERFAFLASRNYRIKTMKLGKFQVISQGLALPVALFPELKNVKVGKDVTEKLKITYASEEDIVRKMSATELGYMELKQRKSKFFKNPLIKQLMRYAWARKVMVALFGKKQDRKGGFPRWIVKTDETRIENAPFYLNSTEPWIKTEKLDGTSCTYAVSKVARNKYEFIVCSRNMRQKSRLQSTYHDGNIYWELADKYDIEKKLKAYAKKKGYHKLVLQGEGVGLVQGNPYKLKENRFYAFNLVTDGVRRGTEDLVAFCEEYDLLHVPVVSKAYMLPKTMEEMKLEADGYSELNPQVKREGFVYRSLDGQQSFKNVSREYLLKHSQ